MVQSPSYNDDVNDPELAKYLNRDYWEQKRMSENIASPSAPSPMSSKDSPSILTTKVFKLIIYILLFSQLLKFILAT